MMAGLPLIWLVGPLTVAFCIGLWVIVPAKMAKKRNREPAIWVILSVIASPLVAIIALLAVGDADNLKRPK